MTGVQVLRCAPTRRAGFGDLDPACARRARAAIVGGRSSPGRWWSLHGANAMPPHAECDGEPFVCGGVVADTSTPVSVTCSWNGRASWNRLVQFVQPPELVPFRPSLLTGRKVRLVTDDAGSMNRLGVGQAKTFLATSDASGPSPGGFAHDMS